MLKSCASRTRVSSLNISLMNESAQWWSFIANTMLDSAREAHNESDRLPEVGTVAGKSAIKPVQQLANT